MTVRDFITDCLVQIGSYGQGQSLADSEAMYVFNALNAMIDEWNASRLNIFTLLDTTFNLLAGRNTYTIGPSGADLGGPRPARIQDANCIVGGFSFNLDLIGPDAWSQILEKAEAAQSARKLYCDYGFPNATLRLWPVPSGNAQLELIAWSPLSGFADLSDTISLPPAYYNALKFNLCVRIGPAFIMQVDPLVAQSAGAAMMAMQKFNAETFGIVPAPGAAPGAPQ